MRSFLICVHDATPAFAHATRTIINELAPLVGRRLAFGVVPDWHGAWALPSHRDYCRLVRDSADELLLHGYFHERQQGWGPTSWLAEGSDEMNGLGAEETRLTLERGQRMFTEVFGEPARGFLAPAWQVGHARTLPLDFVLGFFSLTSSGGHGIPLSTWTWDCGRWGWLGHVGHGVGSVLESLERGVPSLAIHPRDLERGFWPRILRLVHDLIDAGHEPTTPAALLEASDAEVAL